MFILLFLLNFSPSFSQSSDMPPTTPNLEAQNLEQAKIHLYGILLQRFDTYSSDAEQQAKDLGFSRDSFKNSQTIYRNQVNPQSKVWVTQYPKDKRYFLNEIESILYSTDNFYYYVNPRIGIFTSCEANPTIGLICKTVSIDQCDKKPFPPSTLDGYHALAVATIQGQMGIIKTVVNNSADDADIKRICDFEIKQIRKYRKDKKHLYDDIKKLNSIIDKRKSRPAGAI